MVDNCGHKSLNFANGDYYLICGACHRRWSLMGNHPEYGDDKDGNPIGADPNNCVPGFSSTEPRAVREIHILNVSDVKVGDILVPDGGFTCLQEGEDCEVFTNPKHELYVECADGSHFLAGQLNDDCTKYVGFLKKLDGPEGE